MEFGITRELSEKVFASDIYKIISDVDKKLKQFLKPRSYGAGVKEFLIGVICVSPDFEPFLKSGRLNIKEELKLK